MPPRLSDLIWEKSKGRCYYCGMFMRKNLRNDKFHIQQPRDFSVEHLLPKSLGGYKSFDNLVGAHASCNTMRGNLPLQMLPENFRSLCRIAILNNEFGKGFCLPIKEKVYAYT